MEKNDFKPFQLVDNQSPADFDKYVRSFEIFARATKITDQQDLKDNLLAKGGTQLQEIYFLLPEAVEEPDHSKVGRPYDICVNLLRNYFKKQTSRTYEKYLLRQVVQEHTEDFQSFLKRIREQVKNCGFKDQERVDEEILDQIVFGTKVEKLRAELLKDEVSLSVAIDKARLMEGISVQMKAFSSTTSQSVNRLDQRSFKYSGPLIRCYNCGRSGHKSSDSTCPAKEVNCHICGVKGHFAKQCQRNVNARGKKRSREEQPGTSYNKKVRYVGEEEENSGLKRNFIFMVNTQKEARVSVTINNISVVAVIDSGCPVTIVNGKTYAYLISKGLIEKDFTEGCNVPFYGYETNRPAIVIKGSVLVDIKYGSTVISERIYIAPHGRENLLGKKTAESLKLLQVGPMVLNVDLPKTFPCIKNTEVKITIDRSIPPSVVKYRRMPLAVEDQLYAEIHKLLDAGIIEKVPTEEITWVSRMIAVPKDDGEYRLVVDMRLPNTAVSSEYYPQPSVEEVLMLPSVAKMSKIDLKKGFHLLMLAPECRDITAFATREGVFRYTRLMFGLKSAPELFNREIDKIFMNHKGIRKYCDDFLVYGETQEEHDLNLAAVLKTIKDVNLEINEEKSVYNVTEVKFLGHIVTTKGIFPDSDKVAAIKSFRAPQNKDELQTFLGLVTFVGRFIPSLSEKTYSLRKLLTKDVAFNWQQDHDRALNEIKAALSDVNHLSYFVKGRKTILVTDAGPTALGAVLLQQEHDRFFVISYASKALSPVEEKYHQPEKEALGCVWACEKFEIYLMGILFDLWIDYKTLEGLFKPTSRPCARMQRWVLRLQSFTFNVVHKPGKLNIADPLSRLCVNSDASDVSDENILIRWVKDTVPKAVTPREVEEETVKDVQLEAVKNAFRTGNWSGVDDAYVKIKDQLCQVGELLLKQDVIVVPESLRDRIIESAHTGHIGIEAMKSRLRTKVWFPGINKAAEMKVKNCLGCVMTQLENPPNPMSGRLLPSKAWEYVALDFKEGLPDNKTLLVAIDYFSKYVEIVCVENTSAYEMIYHLKLMNARYGNPVKYTVDNGPQFVSAEFNEFCQNQLISIEFSTPYKPNMNGEVERFNRNIKKRVQIAHVEDKDYRVALADYLQVYHNTIHSATGKTPASLMFGHDLRDNLPSISKCSMDLVTREVKDFHDEKKTKAIDRENLKRKAKLDDIHTGDKVFVKNPPIRPGFLPRFGPQEYSVVEKEGAKCTLSANGKKLIRDTSHLKRVPGRTVVEENFQKEGEGEENANPNAVQKEVPDLPVVSRRGRIVKVPSKYDDFVRHVEALQ